MTAPHEGRYGEIGDILDLQGAIGAQGFERADREIDVARLQLRRNLVDRLRRRRDLDPGVARGKGRQNLEPEQPEGGRCRAHADAPALGGARASGEAFERRGFFEQTRSALDEFLALARQPNPPGAAFEHLDAEVILENLDAAGRSEEHTSELQSLMRLSSAVFCLKKKTSPDYGRKMLASWLE